MVTRDPANLTRRLGLGVGVGIGAADEPKCRRDVPLAAERPKILACRGRADLQDPTGGKMLAKSFRDPLARSSLVNSQRVAVEHSNFRWLGRAGSRRFGVRDPLD